jgi:hypothetical protein
MSHTALTVRFDAVWWSRQSSDQNLALQRDALMLYFSFSTLTTMGFGDIVPVNPFARSLANLEAVVGQLYLATTVARLVTLQLEDRRRGHP